MSRRKMRIVVVYRRLYDRVDDDARITGHLPMGFKMIDGQYQLNSFFICIIDYYYWDGAVT